jgi:hypothetical protein
MYVNNAGVMVSGNKFPTIPKMVTGELVNNEVTSRRELLKSLLDPRRDVNAECGYPETEGMLVKDYRQMYERESVGTRVVELEPMESWQIKPEVYEDEDEEVETDFELSWLHVCDNLNQEKESEEKTSWFEAEPKTHPIWEYLKRVDILSGIGHFGVLLIGIDDGKDLKEPIEGFQSNVVYNADTAELSEKKMDAKEEPEEEEAEDKEEEEPAKEPPKTKYKLLYLRAFDEDLVEINTYDTEPSSPRYGQPTMYTVTINDPLNNHQSGIGINTQSIEVHWSRIIHVTDNIGSSELFSAPRMRSVWNRLLDLRKIYGSSGEGYWQGAFPGISLETHPQLGGDVTIDATSTRKTMYDYTNSLQRYIALSGMSAKTLSAQIVDPNPQIGACIDAICIKLRCPKRIFLGSERGELASTQDKDTWDARIKARREDYLTHRLIVPFINRLIRIGVLAEPKTGFKVDWEQEQVETAAEKATTAKTITEALVAYVSGGVDALMEPLDFLVRVVGIPADEAEEILDNAVEHINKANPDLDDVEVAGKQPKAPEPPPQEFPIKMKDGEHLFSPDGKQQLASAPPAKLVKNVGANIETMGESEEELRATLNELLNTPVPTDFEEYLALNKSIDYLEFVLNKFVSPAQRRWWFATMGRGATAKTKGMPRSPSGLKTIKQLGGSTGATLVEDAKGNKYVLKKGASPDHLRSEYSAEQAYRAAGVRIPTSHLYETENGPVKLSKFIEGTEYGKLNKVDQIAAKKALQKDFAADAVLGNWDVIGAGGDNVLVDKKGKAWRIDVGGSLEYRAQGAKKSSNDWNGDAVKEIGSMRNASMNKDSASVFGDMTHDEIKASVAKLASRKSLMEEHLSKKDAKIVGARIDKATEALVKNPNDIKPIKAPKPSSSVSSEKLSAVAAGATAQVASVGSHSLTSSSALVNHMLDKGKVPFTKAQMDKVTFLNPDGIKNGTFVMPLVGATKSDPGNAANLAYMQSILPPGTKIKGVYVSKTQMANASTGVKASTIPTGPKPSTTAGSVPIVKASFPDPSPNNPVIKIEDLGIADNHEAIKNWKKSLSAEENDAIQSWSGTSYRAMRKAIASNPPPPPQNAKQAAAFYTAIAKAPKVDGTAFRGVKGEYAVLTAKELSNIGVGGEWTDMSPHSMSRSSSIATGDFFFDGHLAFQIKTKTGRTIEHHTYATSEQEIIGMPGVRYRIAAIEKNAKIIRPGYSVPKAVKNLVTLEEIE